MHLQIGLGRLRRQTVNVVRKAYMVLELSYLSKNVLAFATYASPYLSSRAYFFGQ